MKVVIWIPPPCLIRLQNRHSLDAMCAVPSHPIDAVYISNLVKSTVLYWFEMCSNYFPRSAIMGIQLQSGDQANCCILLLTTISSEVESCVSDCFWKFNDLRYKLQLFWYPTCHGWRNFFWRTFFSSFDFPLFLLISSDLKQVCQFTPLHCYHARYYGTYWNLMCLAKIFSIPQDSLCLKYHFRTG